MTKKQDTNKFQYSITNNQIRNVLILLEFWLLVIGYYLVIVSCILVIIKILWFLGGHNTYFLTIRHKRAKICLWREWQELSFQTTPII